MTLLLLVASFVLFVVSAWAGRASLAHLLLAIGLACWVLAGILPTIAHI